MKRRTRRLARLLHLVLLVLAGTAHGHGFLVLGSLESEPRVPASEAPFELRVELADQPGTSVEDAVVFVEVYADDRTEDATPLVSERLEEDAPGVYRRSLRLPERGPYTLLLCDQTYPFEEARAEPTFRVGAENDPDDRRGRCSRAGPSRRRRSGSERRSDRSTRADAALASAGFGVTHDPVDTARATESDPRLVRVFEDACRRRGHGYRRMASGAGHDAMQIAAVAPTAMLFVPCEGGVSHGPAEAADVADLAVGAEVMADALVGLDASRGEALVAATRGPTSGVARTASARRTKRTAPVRGPAAFDCL